jgi:hypothetical protein
MTEPLDFETTLEHRLQMRASVASRPFDAGRIAREAIEAAPRRWSLRLPMVDHRVWVVALAALLLLAALGLVAVGAGAPGPEPLLAVARPDGIFLVRQDGDTVVRLDDVGTYPRLAWSADGTLLSVEDANVGGTGSRLTVYRLDGSVAWSVKEPGSDFTGWSHGGHRLAWQSGPGPNGLKVTDVDSGDTQSIPYGGAAAWGSVAWAPGDAWLLVAFPGIQVVQADGSGARALPLPAGRAVQYAAVSPEGTVIAALETCAADGCDPAMADLSILDAATGAVVKRVTGMGGYPMAWSPDGSRVAWRVGLKDGGISVVSTGAAAGDGTETASAGGMLADLAGWTPQGDLLVIETHPSTTCTDAACVPPGGILWRVSPDGTSRDVIVAGVTAAALQPVP